MDGHLHQALREWSTLCQALASGTIVALVRKGGIHERFGGLFELRYKRFVLMPSFEHQDSERLHPDLRGYHVQHTADAAIRLDHWAEVAAAWQIADEDCLREFAQLRGFQGHSEEEVMSRWMYRDQHWVQIVLLRVMALPQPILLPDNPRYRGCRSWIDLESGIPAQALNDSQAVLNAEEFAQKASHCRMLFGDGMALS